MVVCMCVYWYAYVTVHKEKEPLCEWTLLNFKYKTLWYVVSCIDPIASGDVIMAHFPEKFINFYSAHDTTQALLT